MGRGVLGKRGFSIINCKKSSFCFLIRNAVATTIYFQGRNFCLIRVNISCTLCTCTLDSCSTCQVRFKAGISTYSSSM